MTLAILFWVPSLAFTQSVPQFKGSTTFENYMQSLLKNDCRITSARCAEFFLAVKFIINEDGFADSITVLPDVNYTIRTRVIHAIRTTDGTWANITTNDRLPLVLPIYFRLESGCLQGQKMEKRLTDPEKFNLKNFNLSNETDEVFLFEPIYVTSERGFEDIGDDQ